MEIALPRRRRARRHPRDEHDLRRCRHRPARADGRDGSAAVDVRVHPGDEPCRAPAPRARRDAATTPRGRATGRTTRRSRATTRRSTDRSSRRASRRSRRGRATAGCTRSSIALARLTIPGLADNDGAASVDAHHRAELEVLVDQILERVARRSTRRGRRRPRHELDEIVDALATRAPRTYADLVFSQPFKTWTRRCSLDAAQGSRGADRNFPTLWSLRDVDLESNLYLVRN